jgi:hypothetical protein
MGSHPINLTLRFILEIIALISIGHWTLDIGHWAWTLSDTWLHYFYAFSFPVLFAAFWGIFTVKNDPSRSGKAPIPIPGYLRLILELTFFSFATWGLKNSGYSQFALTFFIVVIFHYLLSYDRIKWLIKQ